MSQHLTHKRVLAAVFPELYLGGYVNKAAVNVSLCFWDFLKKTSTGLKGNNLNNICSGLYEKTQPSTLWFANTHTHTHAQHALHTCNSSTNLYAINSGSEEWLSCYPFRAEWIYKNVPHNSIVKDGCSYFFIYLFFIPFYGCLVLTVVKHFVSCIEKCYTNKAIIIVIKWVSATQLYVFVTEAFSQCEQVNRVMTELVSCHRFSRKAPTVHLGKEGARICHGSDHIADLHKTSNNVWFVAF